MALGSTCPQTDGRRTRRVNLQDLALIEFDDLRIRLKEEKAADPIEVQDDLRRVVAYLCRRKHSAKSASVLLLHFFHGYYPEEIGRITLMKRGVIDKLLSTAPEEVKAHFADPACVEFIHYGKPPELMPRQVAVSPERIAHKLQWRFSRRERLPCRGREEIMKHDEVIDLKPIPCGLLAPTPPLTQRAVCALCRGMLARRPKECGEDRR